MLFTKGKISYSDTGDADFIFFLTYQGDVFQNKWEKANALYYCVYLMVTFKNVPIYTLRY